MKTAFTTLIEDIILYNNNRFLILLFLVALIFLWITERDKRIKTVFVYFVTAITVLFCCPLYAWIGMKVDAEIYYRVFWSIPIGIWSAIVLSGLSAILKSASAVCWYAFLQYWSSA